MTAADERAREYAAMQDDCEQLALANAGLLVEVAERAGTVEGVRGVRTTLTNEADDLLAGACLGDAETRARYETLRYAVALLDQVEGL